MLRQRAAAATQQLRQTAIYGCLHVHQLARTRCSETAQEAAGWVAQLVLSRSHVGRFCGQSIIHGA